MSVSNWKELAESKAKAGKMKNQLYNQITAERVKSKTIDGAITKSFRLDEIIEGLKGKPVGPRVRKRGPRIRPGEEEGIDYAPEVDPYEDIDIDIGEANKILDHLKLPSYDDVQKRLDEPEMTANKERNYLEKVVNDADRRRQVIALKSAATIKFKKGLINAA